MGAEWLQSYLTQVAISLSLSLSLSLSSVLRLVACFHNTPSHCTLIGRTNQQSAGDSVCIIFSQTAAPLCSAGHTTSHHNNIIYIIVNNLLSPCRQDMATKALSNNINELDILLQVS